MSNIPEIEILGLMRSSGMDRMQAINSIRARNILRDRAAAERAARARGR